LESAALFNATTATYSEAAASGDPALQRRQADDADHDGYRHRLLDEVHRQRRRYGRWYLFRASDNAYIGKVSSVSNDTTLTLTANAAVAVTVEDYFAIKAGMLSTRSPPRASARLNAVYASVSGTRRQQRVVLRADDFEGIDLDPNSGNFVPMSERRSLGAVADPSQRCSSGLQRSVHHQGERVLRPHGSTPTRSSSSASSRTTARCRA
jgi:hypothetical protein